MHRLRRALPLLGFATTIVPGSAMPQSSKPVPQVYQIERGHSYVGFSIRFMGLTNVRGSFPSFFGTILTDGTPAGSQVTAVIRANSITSHHDTRDKHLKSPDFFDVERFPLIIFRSSRVEPSGSGLMARGSLEMHGVTREVVIPFVQVHRAMRDAWGNTRVGYNGTLKLNRKDFGIQGTAWWNAEFDPGRMAIGDTAEIELNIEAQQPNYANWTLPVPDSLVRVVETRGERALIQDYRAKRQPTDTAGPLPPSALVITALKLKLKSRTDAALQLLRLAVAEYPRDGWALTTLAQTLIEQGDGKAASVLLERALQIEPNNTDAIEWLRWLRSE
jgi:polyisoprenoid-binding protein YceI